MKVFFERKSIYQQNLQIYDKDPRPQNLQKAKCELAMTTEFWLHANSIWLAKKNYKSTYEKPFSREFETPLDSFEAHYSLILFPKRKI